MKYSICAGIDTDWRIKNEREEIVAHLTCHYRTALRINDALTATGEDLPIIGSPTLHLTMVERSPMPVHANDFGHDEYAIDKAQYAVEAFNDRQQLSVEETC